MTRALLRFGSIAFLLLAATPCFAQNANEQEATRQFHLGLDAINQGRTDEARARFRESYALDPKPGTLKNLALAEAELPEYRILALQHFREWLRSVTPTAADRRQADQVLRDLNSGTGHIALVGAAAADVTVDDGNPSSSTADNGVLDVLPGHHSLVRRGSPAKSDVDVAAGATVTVRFETQVTPLPPSAVPQPLHAAPPSTEATPHREPAPLRTWMTIGLGVGAAAFITAGVVLGVQSSNAIDRLNSERTTVAPGSCQNSASSICADLVNQRSTGNTDHTLSTVFYTVGGVAAAGAIASWIFLPKTKEGGSVTPMLSPNTAGVQWMQHF